MGTSTSYNAPPNWGGNKAELTRHSGQSLPANSSENIVRNHIGNNGGARKTASGRGVLGSGTTAKKTATRLGGLFSDVGRYGFEEALRRNSLQHLIGKPLSEVFQGLLDALGEHGNSIDAADARAALADLLDEIEEEITDVNDVDVVFQQKATPEVIARYFGFYIFEQICRVHLEHDLKVQIDDDPERHFNDIKEFIMVKLENLPFNNDISQINWTGREGKAVVQTVINAVLEVFQ